MKLFWITVALTVLSGCATTEATWEKRGATRQDFNMETGQCRAQAFSIPGVSVMQAAAVYSSCMQGKGWESGERPIRR